MNEKPKTQTKLVKHTFTPPERMELGSDLARALSAVRVAETEFESVKAGFKARIAEAEARVETLGTSIENGFEMRSKLCRVELRPKERKKAFFPEIKDGVFESTPAAIEDMTQEDFQQDLFDAEARFERRAELVVFKDSVLVLGRQKGKWFSALRIVVGSRKLEERLDPEAKAYKDRFAAVKATSIRLWTWLTETLGEESAKGFKAQIDTVVEAQKELVE